jgi:flagellar biosynthesis/type III secretory pathway protein FliH
MEETKEQTYKQGYEKGFSDGSELTGRIAEEEIAELIEKEIKQLQIICTILFLMLFTSVLLTFLI